MKKMAADPETQRWWKETDPCQSPLPDAAAKGKIWSDMKEVYHLKSLAARTPALRPRDVAEKAHAALGLSDSEVPEALGGDNLAEFDVCWSD
jgi:hypothetical protein